MAGPGPLCSGRGRSSTRRSCETPSACGLRTSRSLTATTARGAARNSPESHPCRADHTSARVDGPDDRYCCARGLSKPGPAAESLVVRTNLSSERRGLREALAHPGGAAAQDATVELKRKSYSAGRAATPAVIDETPEMDEMRRRRGASETAALAGHCTGRCSSQRARRVLTAALRSEATAAPDSVLLAQTRSRGCPQAAAVTPCLRWISSEQQSGPPASRRRFATPGPVVAGCCLGTKRSSALGGRLAGSRERVMRSRMGVLIGLGPRWRASSARGGRGRWR
jgi:hypothetical protein